MEAPILSIVIPVYNAENYLPQCIESLLASQVPGMEIVLVDDGSTDNSGALCDVYGKKYPCIRVLHKENSGPSATRNAGLALAKGEYIAFFDSDDYVDGAALQHTVSKLSQYPAGELWVSDFCRVSDGGGLLDRIEQIPRSPEPYMGREHLPRFLEGRACIWNVWRYIFHRDFLEQHGLRFIEGVDCAEDMEFMLRVLTQVKDPVFYHNPYYHYRISYGNTLTRRYTCKRVRDVMEMLRASEGHLDTWPREEAQPLRDKLAWEYVLNLPLYRQVADQERQETGRLLAENRTILAKAAGGIYRAADLMIKYMGVPCVSWVLLQGKRLRRRVRLRKDAAYRRRSHG